MSTLVITLRALLAIVVGVPGMVSMGIGLVMAVTGLPGAGIFAFLGGLALLFVAVWIGPDDAQR